VRRVRISGIAQDVDGSAVELARQAKVGEDRVAGSCFSCGVSVNGSRRNGSTRGHNFLSVKSTSRKPAEFAPLLSSYLDLTSVGPTVITVVLGPGGPLACAWRGQRGICQGNGDRQAHRTLGILSMRETLSHNFDSQPAHFEQASHRECWLNKCTSGMHFDI
jgi:hypothetical protein